MSSVKGKEMWKRQVQSEPEGSRHGAYGNAKSQKMETKHMGSLSASHWNAPKRTEMERDGTGRRGSRDRSVFALKEETGTIVSCTFARNEAEPFYSMNHYFMSTYCGFSYLSLHNIPQLTPLKHQPGAADPLGMELLLFLPQQLGFFLLHLFSPSVLCKQWPVKTMSFRWVRCL